MSTNAMSYRLYKSKASALKRREDALVVNKGITQYFHVSSYQEFLNVIKESSEKDFYEFIPANTPVKLFFDVEIYNNFIGLQPDYFLECKEFVQKMISRVKNEFPTYNVSPVVLESHNEEKRSYHLIFTIRDSDGDEMAFSSVKELKDMYRSFRLETFKDSNGKHLIDPSVYREGLFRTIHSSKTGENRYLIRSDLSDDFEDLQSFVCYFEKAPKLFDTTSIDTKSDTCNANCESNCESCGVVNEPEDLGDGDKSTIIKFVQKQYHHLPNRVRDLIIDKEHNCIVVSLNERYCPFLEREHKSNNGYIVIDTCSAKQKCHDVDCNEKKHNEIKLEELPVEISEILKKCLKVNKQEMDLIDKAIEECRNYITENFDGGIQNVSFDPTQMVFRGEVTDQSLVPLLRGSCPRCNVQHQITNDGYSMKCTVCHANFPRNQVIPVDGRYMNLTSFWNNYTQLVNHGVINQTINIFNGGEEEFSCDVKLDSHIFRNREVTNIVNQILDGHKITMVSKLLYTINKNFVYSKGNWYFFDSAIWKSDNDSIEMKKEIMELAKPFDKIKTHYDSRRTEYVTVTLGKNIKSMINKLHKPGFQDDVIKGAKIYFNDEAFVKNLNSKKHLVPFTNGVHDLIKGDFRKTKKDDWINLTVGYNHDHNVSNKEVYTFLEQVLPNKSVRDYVLKKMSECLNGDIPNTNFLMFIGDSGANGKSQLLNLMKLAMGEFGEKVEVTLITRKRNNANEANTEKIKLMNKRFAFLSEPEDGEKINIGLLKELTGSEEIVARGLYQDAISFVMEAKLFLACNELPEIKGEDTALWRRIRVVDFPSQFVDNPKEPNEYPIDRTLPSRMREDISWRQTFMNILIEYYNKVVEEPQEVKVKTNEYKDDNNNQDWSFFDSTIKKSPGKFLVLHEIASIYYGIPKPSRKDKSTLKKTIDKWVKATYPGIDLCAEYRVTPGDNTSKKHAWRHLEINDESEELQEI